MELLGIGNSFSSGGMVRKKPMAKGMNFRNRENYEARRKL
jgi:hypothetical protein